MTYAPSYPQRAVYGYGGAVSAGSPLAASAGLDVLRSGGNAVDAAVGAALVQSVVELPWGGIGGDAFVLVRTPDGAVGAINGSGAAPLKLATRVAEGATIPRFGPLSVGVPGFVAAIEALHVKYGRTPFAALCAPAIGYAADGFAVPPELHAAIADVRPSLDPTAPLAQLLASVPGVGGRLRQERLADTLTAVAAGGAREFYGRLGESIAGHLAAGGGAMSPDDFGEHTVAWVAPLHTSYRGRRVHTHPPVSLGCVLLQQLELYDRLGLGYYAPDDPRRIDAMVRCKHAAFAHTMEILSDPAHRVPGAVDLLDADALDRIAERLLERPPGELEPEPLTAADGTDTTCVVAIDAEGCVAAVIHSLFNEFGSRELDPATGVLLNDRLANQRLTLDGRGGLAPGGRPLHTLNAVLVTHAERPELMLATPGGRGQVQTSFQVLVNMIDGQLDPQQAIDAPRWLSGAPRRSEPDDALYLEPDVDPTVDEVLSRQGHHTVRTDVHAGDLFGSCVAVGSTADGALFAAADHRREARTATF